MRQLQRRQFLIATGALLAAPLTRAQVLARLPVIGMLSPQPMPTPEQWANTAYAKRLTELGWIDGKNVVVVQARGEGREDRLPALAEELVRKRVDVILAHAPEAAVSAARATKSVPIVFWGVSSAVELGLVPSLARPAGNVTGVAWNAGGEVQVAKSLELLKQIAPSVKRLASIWNPSAGFTVAGAEYVYPEFESALRGLGFDVRTYEARRDEDLEGIFAAILASRAQAITAPAMPLTGRNHRRIVDFANHNRLPSAFDARFFVEAGGLVSYGPDIPETQRRAIDYVDRILRGTRPADLPVEMPSRFEVAVNLKTARSLGLTVPQSVLLRADRVIE